MELCWKRKGIKRIGVRGERLYGTTRFGKVVEIDALTGSLNPMQSLPPELYVSKNPSTLRRARGKRKYWKQVFGKRSFLFLCGDDNKNKIVYKIERFNNIVVGLLAIGTEDRRHGWRTIFGSEIALLDWDTGRRIWESKSRGSGIDFWNTGKVLAVRVKDKILDRQTIRFYDTSSEELIEEIDFSEKSRVTVTAQGSLLAILETPRKQRQGSERLILLDGQKIELKTYGDSEKHFFVKSEKDDCLLVWESNIESQESKIFCYSTISAGLLWIRDLSSLTKKKMLDPLDLRVYKDLIIVVTGAPTEPGRIWEYLPRFFYVIDKTGCVIWSSRSIPRVFLPIFICPKCRKRVTNWPAQSFCHCCGKSLTSSNIIVISGAEIEKDREEIARKYPLFNLPREQIDDWVIGVEKDHVVVREGKLVAHWAFADPYGYGMFSTPSRLFNVYNGQLLRAIERCVHPIMTNGKIVYLRSLEPSYLTPTSRKKGPPTEVVIEDVIKGELLRVKGESCFCIKGHFIIKKGNEISAFK